ncbi:hypothetical protein L2E82_40747 [Cichorium intybus]|uniref:Uncharacterized protein n=1 Tax=Cichorium intybus TaxID=13427 RepID=A0ACB9AL53_CICIN|nr:hypothetical protein L2E82_40747 [Cichorium intybus]
MLRELPLLESMVSLVQMHLHPAPTRKITDFNGGVVISEILNYHVKGLVFEGGNSLEDLSNVVADSWDLFKVAEPIIEQPLATTDAMSMINCGKDDLSSQELSVTDIDSFQNDGSLRDLFKAAEPIIEQPLATLNAMSMINCGKDDLSSQELNVMNIESFQNDGSLSEIFHEFKEILAKEATETSPLSEVLNYNLPVKTDEIPIGKENVHPPGQIPKSVSSECLSLMEWINGAQMKSDRQFLEDPLALYSLGSCHKGYLWSRQPLWLTLPHNHTNAPCPTLVGELISVLYS